MRIVWYNKENMKLSSVKVKDESHIEYYLLDFIWTIKGGMCEGDRIVIEEEKEDQKNEQGNN